MTEGREDHQAGQARRPTPRRGHPGRGRPRAPDGPDGLEALRRRLQARGAPRAGPGGVPLTPMLATLVDEPPAGPGWLFEIKYDGVRVLASRDGGPVALVGRSGQDFTARYPEVVEALEALPLERFVLDGEVVALDAQGRPSFQRLQLRMHLTRPADVARARQTVPVVGIFFDALALDGRDLREQPLAERKACLALALPAGGAARRGEHVSDDGQAFWHAACAQRVEGIVAKRADSPYVAGRARAWLKVKCQLRQEFVIGGYTDPQGTRAHFGALHLGLYEGDRLVYVSKVGTGFDDRALGDLWARLRPLARPSSPFAAGTPTGRGHHWVEPRLVCEVRFSEWTDEGGLRHPAYLGLRPDKRPEECRREIPAPVDAVDSGNPGPRRGSSASRTPGPAPGAPAGRPAVAITNATKVFWPEDGFTKGDLAAYYERVAPLLLPYLRDRPLVLVRHPDGIHGKSFFQKDAPPSTPSWIRTAAIWSEETTRDVDYLLVDDVEGLRWVVNLGTIPLHVWGSRVVALDRPDWLVLDLDPKEAPFVHVVRVALAARDVLAGLDVPSHVKTSGATGLHVLVPLGARYAWDVVRTFAQLLATLVVQADPRIATVARPLRQRGGKVYVDWGQNARGQTIVAPFAVRPRPGAPVSCPLRWDEVDERLDPRRFTIRTAPERFETLGDPLAPVLTGGIDLGAVLRRLGADPALVSAGAAAAPPRARRTRRRPAPR